MHAIVLAKGATNMKVVKWNRDYGKKYERPVFRVNLYMYVY